MTSAASRWTSATPMAASPPAPCRSTTPGAFADDQLGLMDHLGIDQFFYMGYCIGGCFAGKLRSGAGPRRRRRLLPERRPSAGRPYRHVSA